MVCYHSGGKVANTVCVSVCEREYMLCVCVCARGDQKKAGSPGARVTGIAAQCGIRTQVHEQQVLLTTDPSFQPIPF